MKVQVTGKILKKLKIKWDNWNSLSNEFYKNDYSEISRSAITDSLAFKVLHKSLEKGLKKEHFENVLELGGNMGEHIPFVKHGYTSYCCSDINFQDGERPSILDKRVVFKYENAEKLSFMNSTHDRVIITCLLHHVEKPEEVLRESKRVLRPGGILSIFLPHDPGILYRVTRGLTTLRAARKRDQKDAIQLLHAREHRNHFLSLEYLLRYVFDEDEIYKISFPATPLGYNLNAFSVYQIRTKDEFK